MQKKWMLGLVVLALALIAVVMPLAAHEGREVGDYSLSFGWRNEPAYAGMMNGPEVFIEPAHGHSEGEAETDHEHEEAENPLEGIEVSLQAEVTFGDQSITLPLRQSFSDPTHFIAELIPTLPGDYVFRIFGTIGDVDVNETFDSADGEFSSVEPATDIMFPAVGGMDDSRIADLEARIAELEAIIEEIGGQ